jgi:hypothetical protein
LGVVTGALTYAAPSARGDDDWNRRYNAYRHHWDDHHHWRDHYYQPYYRHHYHRHYEPYYSRYYSSYPRTYYYRPSYGGYYYQSPYGYRDYRYGGAVQVGPLQFYWR